MDRPWVSPKEVRDYSDSKKVKAREDNKLAFDIARAEKYVIHHTHNHFDTAEYEESLPLDVRMAVILLAEAYAKQSILHKEGNMNSETFDDYSYTMDADSDIAEHLGLETMLSDYILESGNGKAFLRMRKL